jgi:hypothetical protein
MASRGFFGDLYDALTGSGPCHRKVLNGCEVRILAFTYRPDLCSAAPEDRAADHCGGRRHDRVADPSRPQ